MADTSLREFIYLDDQRVRSMAAQLGVQAQADPEQMFFATEPALMGKGAITLDDRFDFAGWVADGFKDGQLVVARGLVRLLDFNYLTVALGGLPAVLRKMSKIEMAALRNSDEGRRLSKSAIQQKTQENQLAIAKVEEFKVEELGDVIRQLYGDVVRVKVRPSKEHPNAVLVGSAYSKNFYDSPGAMSQKYGVDVDSGWTVVGQLNIPHLAGGSQPIPTGNQMEDSFEQIAVLMNNAFRMANSPAFPAISFTPIAIYRAVG
jgi:hypothetical protein